MLIWMCQCNGQSLSGGESLRGLKVGDQVPDYEFTNVINYTARNFSLLDFKGKLLILDFWNTSCSSCIASWPHLMNIQKAFKDKIQIVLVNPRQNEDVVRKTFERRKKLTGVDVDLPSVCYDTNITKLFPVSGIPHVVWIGRDGVLESITYSASVNSKNITALLKGEKVRMPQKLNNDEYISAIFQKPLFLGENGGDAKEVYSYSFFGKGDEKLFPTYGLVSNAKRKEYYIVLTNYCIKDFYRLAYSNRMTHLGLEMILPNKTLLQSSDSIKYIERVDGELMRDNLFVYQVITPPTSLLDLQLIMQSDLKKYIGLEARWIKVRKKCLVLSAQDTTQISYKAGGRRAVINDTNINLNNVTIKYFLDFLEDGTEYYWSPYPFVDETNFKGLLGDIEFETNVSDYKQLDGQLRKYKMSLVIQERIVDVLLITDSNKNKAIGQF